MVGYDELHNFYLLIYPMQPYPAEIEQRMQRFYQSLSEKDRRRYAAVEALKLEWGGKGYISQLLGCDDEAMQLGRAELDELESLNMKRIRREGGGRKLAIETIEGIDAAFLKVIREHTAGSPMDEMVKWTNLTHQEIAHLLEQEGIRVSVTVVGQLLSNHNYRKRQAQKRIATGNHPHRNEQFEKIKRLKTQYQDAGHPVLSMDTKKKELLGLLYREGKLYTQDGGVLVFDHDWRSLATGIAIPHGLYDLSRNEGYIQIGTSHDTSAFACDSIRSWWNQYGRIYYATATCLLLLCDGGGSNDARHYLFKQDIQENANELGIEIRIAHYPPYTSKYNPIEHRLFPHVTRACQGVILTSVEQVQALMGKAKTKTGLRVFTTILDKVYETGRKVSKEFKQTMKIVFDKDLSKWNYTAKPQPA